MLKTLMITAAVGGLVISGALAQSTSGGGAGHSPTFIAMQSSDQWVFSKFKGSDVVGPNDEAIGGVTDLLFDKNGKILGMIVGVGGFLGIGQKNVAMDMSAFQVMPATTSTTTKPPEPATSNATADPTKVKLKVALTKDQLQQAPDFQYYKAPSGSASNDLGSVPKTTGQRSAPMAPAPASK